MNYRQSKAYAAAKLLTSTGELEIDQYTGNGKIQVYSRNYGSFSIPLKTAPKILQELK